MIKFYEEEDAAKEIDKLTKTIDDSTEEFKDTSKSLGELKEDGEDLAGKPALIAFLDASKADAQRRAEEIAIKNDDVVKNNILARQSNICKDTCTNYMLGNLYMKSLPLDPDDKVAHEDELRNDLKKYVDDKGGALRYVQDACTKESARSNPNPATKLLKLILEAADNEVRNFNAAMGIGFNTKTADDIVFSLDNSMKKRLDRITDTVDFDDITSAISKNVTDAAVAEIQRSKEEEAAKQALEDEIKNNTGIVTPEQVQEFVSVRNTTVAPEPSLFESIMIGKVKAMTESGSDVKMEKALAESVCEFTKLSMDEAFGFTRRNKYDLLKLGYQYRK